MRTLDSYDEIKRKVIDEGYDCGTGSWAVVCDKIKMELNEYGEYVPNLASKEEITQRELDLLQQVSQVANDKVNEDVISKELYEDIPNIHYDSRLGYYLDTYVGHVLEGDFRKNASSGGFGTWIFKELFDRNEIDGVIHVKQSKSDKRLFDYAISTNLEEIKEGAKTKYYPVEFSNVLQEVKDRGGSYAFIGLPAHVMELRLLMKQDSDLNDRIKFIVGLICGHQKTSKFADFLAWQCGVEPGKLKDINFRYKIENQPANQYGIEIYSENDEGKDIVVRKQMKELFGVDWGQGFFKVKGSDFTDDVMNETADITLGDAWLPEYTTDSSGNNVIIVRNVAIKTIIDEGINNNKIKVDKVSKDKIFASQESHYRHTHDELSYRLEKKVRMGKWVPHKRVAPSSIQIPFVRKRIQDTREEITQKSKEYFYEAENKNDLQLFISKMTPLTKKYKNLYRVEKIRKKGFLGIMKSLYNKIVK